ncbi:MAG: MBL fold metallo-hydrolase [Acidobacteriota bacterium]
MRRRVRSLSILASLAILSSTGWSWAQATPGGGIAIPGMSPTDSVIASGNSMQFFPGTESLAPNEMRVSFMGSSPLPRRGQSGMSIYVELGNGEAFIFDMGPGSVHNYLGMQIPYPEINDIFITHLHADHWLDVLFVYPFGAWSGRWEPLRIYGPSGEANHDGTAYWGTKVKELMTWHRDAFSLVPIGDGLELQVQEFPWNPAEVPRDPAEPITDCPSWLVDPGKVVLEAGTTYDQYCGVVYRDDVNNVLITHWPASHAKDGASSYRLDWTYEPSPDASDPSQDKRLTFVYTGDTRPTELARQFSYGVDMLVTECQPETFNITGPLYGMPAEMAQYTLDTHHTPAYAAGELFARTNPLVGVCSHITWDHNLLNEVSAEVRENWSTGLFLMGAPDNIVFNIQAETEKPVEGGGTETVERRVWQREGVIPEYANAAQAETPDDLCIPAPTTCREAMQDEFLRTAETNEGRYYVSGSMRDLITEWQEVGVVCDNYCDGATEPVECADKILKDCTP